MRLQFGILTLLLLTTAIAAVLGILRPLNLPPELYGAMLVYSILIAVYVVIRSAVLWRRYRKKRDDARSSREELSALVEEARGRPAHRSKQDGV